LKESFPGEVDGGRQSMGQRGEDLGSGGLLDKNGLPDSDKQIQDQNYRDAQFDRLLNRRKSTTKMVIKNPVQLGELFLRDQFSKGHGHSIASQISKKAEMRREMYSRLDETAMISPDASAFNLEILKGMAAADVTQRLDKSSASRLPALNPFRSNRSLAKSSLPEVGPALSDIKKASFEVRPRDKLHQSKSKQKLESLFSHNIFQRP